MIKIKAKFNGYSLASREEHFFTRDWVNCWVKVCYDLHEMKPILYLMTMEGDKRPASMASCSEMLKGEVIRALKIDESKKVDTIKRKRG